MGEGQQEQGGNSTEETHCGDEVKPQRVMPSEAAVDAERYRTEGVGFEGYPHRLTPLKRGITY